MQMEDYNYYSVLDTLHFIVANNMFKDGIDLPDFVIQNDEVVKLTMVLDPYRNDKGLYIFLFHEHDTGTFPTKAKNSIGWYYRIMLHKDEFIIKNGNGHIRPFVEFQSFFVSWISTLNIGDTHAS